MPPSISVEETAQQMVVDMENYGARAVLSEEQLAAFLSPEGHLTLRIWEFNRSQNNEQTNQAIHANTQLANVLAARSELGAACASEEARSKQANRITNMIMVTCLGVVPGTAEEFSESWAQWGINQASQRGATQTSVAEEIPLNPKNLKAIAQPAVDAWVAGGGTSEGRFEVKAQIKVLVNKKWGGYNRRNDIIRVE